MDHTPEKQIRNRICNHVLLGAQDNEGAVLFALGNGKKYRGIICPCVLNRHASFPGVRQHEPEEEMSEAA